MTYNPRIKNIDNNIIDISGNLNISINNGYLSGNIFNVSSLTVSTLISGNYIASTSSNINLGIMKRKAKIITGSIIIDPANDESLILADPRSDIDIKLPISISSSGEEYIIKKINDSSNVINIIPFGDISWKEQAYFLAPLTGAFLVDDNFFGTSIASNGAGNVIIVGSPNRTIDFTRQGAAFIYRSGTTGWKLEATLTTSSTDVDPDLTEIYTGQGVSINNAGNLALVSSTDYRYNYVGKGLIFRSSSTGWKQEQSVLPVYLDGTGNSENSIFQNATFNSTGNYFISPGRHSNGTYARGRVFRSSSIGWYLDDVLTASIGITSVTSGDLNGAGNIAIIGMPTADPGGSTNAGTVNIFRSSSAGWNEETRLTGTVAGQQLGSSVLLTEFGNIIFARMYVNVNTLEPGMAVYRSSSAGWRRESVLTGTNPNYLFSDSEINYAGNIVITPVANTINNITGSFAVFRSSSVGWRQDTTLITSSIHAYSQDTDYYFRTDMDSAGNTLIVGSPTSDIPFKGNGAFMVFQNTAGTTWKEETFITGPLDSLLEENIALGTSVDIDGDGIVIIAGSPDSNYSSSSGQVTSSAGSCVIYRSSSNGWRQEAYITSSVIKDSPSSFIRFGKNVKINKSGNKLAVKGDGLASATASYSGFISIWNSSSTGWKEETILSSSLANIDSNLSINNNINKIAAGTTFLSIPSSSAGGVAIFNSSSTGWKEEVVLTSSGDSNPTADRLGISVAMNGVGDVVAAGTTGYDIPYSNVGGIIVFRSSSVGWKEETILKTTSNITNNQLGSAIAINEEGSVIAATNGKSINIFKSSSNGWYTDKFLKTKSSYNITSIDMNSKGNIIIAADPNSGYYSSQGTLYVFRSSSAFGWEELYNLTSSENGNIQDNAYFGTSIAISNSGSVIVGCSTGMDLVSGNYTSSDAGSVTIFNYSSTDSLLQDNLSKNNYLNNSNIFYDKIDKMTKFQLSSPYASLRVVNDGTGSWSII